MKRILLSFLIAMISGWGHQVLAQTAKNSYWKFSKMSVHKSTDQQRLKELPTAYQFSRLNTTAWGSQLKNVPKIDQNLDNQSGFELQLPTPEGDFSSFFLSENSIIAAKVAHLYTVKTYQGYAKDAPQI